MISQYTQIDIRSVPTFAICILGLASLTACHNATEVNPQLEESAQQQALCDMDLICDPGEDAQTCPDCEGQLGDGGSSGCGDGFCDVLGGEDDQNCAIDCLLGNEDGGVGGGFCGDGICEPIAGEDATTCPIDCDMGDDADGGVDDVFCNYDNVCDANENITICPEDCTPCAFHQGLDGGCLDGGIDGGGDGDGDGGPSMDAGDGDGDGDGDGGPSMDAGDGDGDGDGDGGPSMDAGDGDGDGGIGMDGGDGEGDGGTMFTDGGCDMCSPDGAIRCKNDHTATMLCVDGCWEYTECDTSEICTNTTGGESCTDDAPGESVQCEEITSIGEDCTGMAPSFRCSGSTVERCTSLGGPPDNTTMPGEYWIEVDECESEYQCLYAASSVGDGCCRDICSDEACTCVGSAPMDPMVAPPSFEIPLDTQNCPPIPGGTVGANFTVTGTASQKHMHCSNDCTQEKEGSIGGKIDISFCSGWSFEVDFALGGKRVEQTCKTCEKEGEAVGEMACRESCDMSAGTCTTNSLNGSGGITVKRFWGADIKSGAKAGLDYGIKCGAEVHGTVSGGGEDYSTYPDGLTDECKNEIGCNECDKKKSELDVSLGASAGCNANLKLGSWEKCFGFSEILSTSVGGYIRTEKEVATGDGTCENPYDCRETGVYWEGGLDTGCVTIPVKFLDHTGVQIKGKLRYDCRNRSESCPSTPLEEGCPISDPDNGIDAFACVGGINNNESPCKEIAESQNEGESAPSSQLMLED